MLTFTQAAQGNLARSANLFRFWGSTAFMLFTLATYAQTTRTVCASGCNHTTIAAAVAASVSGDIIHVNTALHTENGITITNKNLTIKGNGIAATTLQGHASRATAANRIFTIVGSSAITIEDIKSNMGMAMPPMPMAGHSV